VDRIRAAKKPKLENFGWKKNGGKDSEGTEEKRNWLHTEK